MDIGKLDNLAYGEAVKRANKLAKTLGKEDDPEWAESLALALLKNRFHPDDDELARIIALFGSDEDISNGLFPAEPAEPDAEEPVTVTKTTTSVGGLPSDFGATSEEAAAGAVEENPSLLEEILATPDDQLDAFLAEKGLREPVADKPAEDKPAEKSEDKPADKSAEEKPADKPEDKPAEKSEDKPTDKPAEEKPADKPEEKKEDKPADKPAEDKKDGPSDTMKNITSALGDRF